MSEHRTLERQPLIARSMNLPPPIKSQQHSQNLEHEVSPVSKRVLIESPVQKIADIETISTRKATKRTKHESPTKLKIINQTHPISAESWKRTFSIEKTNAKVREWQRQYRKAFPSFRFYFDSVDQNMKHKLTKQINKLGGTVDAFFSKSITHVITTRPIPDFTDISLQLARKSVSNSDTTFNIPSSSQSRHKKLFGFSGFLKDASITGKSDQELLKNDVLIKAHEYDMKIWSFDKFVNRILRSLLDPLIPSQPKLSHLLYDEKVNGTRERDRTAPREDYVYFKGPYLFVRDISNIYRPIIIKEWPKPPNGKASEGEWPQFRVTDFGHCPFVRENSRKSHYLSSLPKHEIFKELQNIPEASKNLEVLHPLKDNFPGVRNQVQYMFYQPDINASGIIQSNLTSAIRSQTSTNAKSGGMGGPITIPLSKSVDDLKRKLFIQVQQRLSIQENMNTFQQSRIDPTDKKKVKVENKPGYCENCREKFENFDQHINSRRHIKYATNDENFAELDELLITLKRKRLPWNVET